MAIIPNLQALKAVANVCPTASAGPFDLNRVQIAPIDERNLAIRAASPEIAVSVALRSIKNGSFDRAILIDPAELTVKATDQNGQALAADGGPGTLKTPHGTISEASGTAAPIEDAIKRLRTESRCYFRVNLERLTELIMVCHSVDAKEIDLSFPMEESSKGAIGIESIGGDFTTGFASAALAVHRRLFVEMGKRPTVPDTYPAPVSPVQPANETKPETVKPAPVSSPVQSPPAVSSVSLDSILSATMHGGNGRGPEGETIGETVPASPDLASTETPADPMADDTDDETADVDETDRPKRTETAARVTRGTGPQGNGIEIVFSRTPSIETRADIKRAGFRWSGRQGLWYARKSTGSERMAQIIENVFAPMASE